MAWGGAVSKPGPGEGNRRLRPRAAPPAEREGIQGAAEADPACRVYLPVLRGRVETYARGVAASARQGGGAQWEVGLWPEGHDLHHHVYEGFEEVEPPDVFLFYVPRVPVSLRRLVGKFVSEVLGAPTAPVFFSRC